jgi:lysophospholipase L1-like esterase
MTYRRFVALGDSLTEGVGDGDDVRGLRGWADRLAELLAAADSGVRYANLAVRGRLAADVRDVQVPAALALRPDLVTVSAGMNDLIRPGCRIEEVADCLDDTFELLTTGGARVVTMTYPDIARLTPMARLVTPRLLRLNARIRAAERFGVTVVDVFPHRSTTDPRLWTADRLHASPAGCARLAAAFAHALGLPGSDATWTDPLPPAPPSRSWDVVAREALWFAGSCVPFVHKRVRGRSAGDGRTPKRPELTPVARPDPVAR